MKPDWDALAQEFASSDKVLIADVDCTAGGEALCEKFGVQGFPTIKSFSPPDEDGEDYEGERSLEELREFVKTLGPGCSAISKENCTPEQLAELEELMKKSPEELAAEVAAIDEKLSAAQEAHDELVKGLEKQYEESEEGLQNLKKELKPRSKMLKAATAKPQGETLDSLAQKLREQAKAKEEM